ncbi:MAG: DNA-processing protein DprA [Rhodovibrionaceae bacterium]
MHPPERLAALRLIRSENVGPITYRQLIARYGSAEAGLDALPELARQGGRRRGLKLYSQGEAEREVEALESFGARLLVLGAADYPEALAALPDAPPVLSALGPGSLVAQRLFAMVGARNASANGQRLAERIARDLGEAGFTVVSGLARGIDAAAHRGSLAAGTTAVLAGGIDVVYPPQNQELYAAIAAQGLLLSEMPPGLQPQARHFPRRNRIISGLCEGVLVVEAAPRSGSLITARLAGEQGREVFAIPGSPLDPRARGCNDLLRQGAVLTESAEDIVNALSGQIRRSFAAPSFRAEAAMEVPESVAESGLEEAESAASQIEALLGPGAVTVDELVRRCQLSPAVVSLALLELELAGRLERQPGNRISLVAEREARP